jgi:glycerol-3-phosphate dehydrogenase
MLLDGRTSLLDMGAEIAPGLYAAEVAYLLKHEWAKTAADILWRRSKLGLHLPSNTAALLNEWMQRHHALDYDSATV